MDICLLWVSCVVRQRSLRRADHLSRGVLPTLLRRCVWSRNIKNRCSIYIYIYDISTLRVKKGIAQCIVNLVIRTNWEDSFRLLLLLPSHMYCYVRHATGRKTSKNRNKYRMHTQLHCSKVGVVYGNSKIYKQWHQALSNHSPDRCGLQVKGDLNS